MITLPTPIDSGTCRHCKETIYQFEYMRSSRKKWSTEVTEERVLEWFHEGPAPKDGHLARPSISSDPDLDNILSGLYD